MVIQFDRCPDPDPADGEEFKRHDHDPYRRGLGPVLLCPNCDEGQCAVEVLNGDIYLFDLDAMTVTRLSAPRLFRQVFDLSDRSLASDRAKRFRQDGRAVRLVILDPIRDNQPINMLLEVRGDGVLTYRSTARVTSVWPLPVPSHEEWDGNPL